MIKLTCQDPATRIANISQGVSDMGLQDGDLLEAFGVELGDKMAIIQGRVLPPPAISFHPMVSSSIYD
jgi:eukaryotic translation initiation factor 2C